MGGVCREACCASRGLHFGDVLGFQLYLADFAKTMEEK